MSLMSVDTCTMYIKVNINISRGRYRLIVGFTTTCAISAYHYDKLWVRILLMASSRYSIQHYMIVCHWLATGQWFSLSNPVFFTNKTDRHDIIEILLKVALNTITLTLTMIWDMDTCPWQTLKWNTNLSIVNWISMKVGLFESVLKKMILLVVDLYRYHSMYRVKK